MDWIRSIAGSNRPMPNERFVAPKKTTFEFVEHYLPILGWLSNYNVRRDIKFDIVAGITVAMMLIPQEVSLSAIMHVPAHHGLYTAATSPLVYALFGSSTVLSVASGSEVALLTGSILEPIEDENERIATGIMIAFLSGVILLLVRIFNLSQIADFFSRPVMGGFISAGGLLIMLSQFQNVLGVKFDSQDYPVQPAIQNDYMFAFSNKNALAVGLISIAYLIAVKLIKKRFFPSPVLSQLFDDPEKTTSTAQAPNGTNFTNSHGFSITDEQYVGLASARAQVDENETKFNKTVNDSPKSKPVLIAIFLARTLSGANVSVISANYAKRLRFREVPDHGRSLEVRGINPGALEPRRGFDNGLIDGGRFGTILLNSLTVALVVFLSSIAMSKRLAIQRGEDINTEQELTGIGAASVVCGFFQAMPPTGGMSRTAVNMQNAHTQLASIITTFIVILSLYTLTGTLYYLPRATLASPTVTRFRRGHPTWVRLTNVTPRVANFFKHDAALIWIPIVDLPEGPGYVRLCSVLALMIKTKRSPVVILGELANGSLVDRDLFTDANDLNDIIVIRAES
ncbi:Hypothetical protein PHPALM_2204, partial [Phytophthora palmivora]